MLIALPQTRSPFFKGLADVSKAFFIPRLLLPLASYFAYASLIVFASYRIGFWDVSLTKDTIIAVCFVGLPILFNQVTGGSKLLRRVLLETVGASALVVFYLGLEPLSLAGELFAQSFIALCVMLGAVGNLKPETKKVGGCFQVLAGIAAIGLLIFVTTQIIKKWDGYDWGPVVSSFFLSIWVPIALIPFIYIFSFVARCQTILVRLPRFNNHQVPPLRTRLGLVVGLHVSDRLASLFTGGWHRKITRSETFRDSLDIMKKFRSEVRQRAQDEKSRVNLLKQNAGVQGTDAEGLAIDRREFFETKEVLDSLFYYQMASKSNKGNFRADLLENFGHLAKKRLPKDHGIQFLLRKDRDSWRVWRMTPGGWFFGMGGTPNVDEKWTYFGAEAPTSFPGENHPNWFNDLKDASCEEWIKDDRPIRPS